MGTLQFSQGIDALGLESVIFIPGGAAAKGAVLATEAKATSTIHLTCNIRQFNANAEQAKTKKYRLCSKQAFDALGRVEWNIEDITFIDDPQAPNSSTSYLHKSITPGTVGDIVRRRGIDSSPGSFVDFAEDQLYDLFPVKWGVRIPVPVAPEEEGQEFEYRQVVAVTGPRYEGAFV